MTLLISFLVVLFQILVGYLLGLVIFPMVLGGFFNDANSNLPISLIPITLGMVVGIWGVGFVASRWRKHGGTVRHFVGTLIGGSLGALLIAVTPATGFGQISYPLVGTLLGYYLVPRIWRRE